MMGDQMPESPARKLFVLIYGGSGALGSTCVSKFAKNNFLVISVDRKENPEAAYNIVVNWDKDLVSEEAYVLFMLREMLMGTKKLAGIYCVAGGWDGGNAGEDLAKSAQLMWKKNVWSSVICTSIAVRFLSEGGMLVFSGAQAALEPTPTMVGYGVAKAAVHHLVKSLAGDGSGLPKNTTVTGILPKILDTPMNRRMMPEGDATSWTPLEEIAEMFLKWARNEGRPTANGCLSELVTKDGKTDVLYLLNDRYII